MVITCFANLQGYLAGVTSFVGEIHPAFIIGVIVIGMILVSKYLMPR